MDYSKNGGSSYTTYFYATNAQGDVEGLFQVILNTSNGKYEQLWYGRYTYDAWGNVTATTASGGTPSATSVIVRNPLRYRGYVYDNETGWYYLQSRYYDPASHRFINADIPEYSALAAVTLVGSNFFSYCQNRPVIAADENGEWLNIVIGTIVGGIFGFVSEAIDNEWDFSGDNIWECVLGSVAGSLNGAAMATGNPAVAYGVTALTSTCMAVYTNYNDVKSGDKTVGEAIVSGIADVGYEMLCAAIGFGGPSTFNESTRLTAAFFNSRNKMAMANHPAVKAAYSAAEKQLRKFLIKTTVEEVVSAATTTAIGWGHGKLVEAAYDYYQ